MTSPKKVMKKKGKKNQLNEFYNTKQIRKK